ncbi:nicotinate/nicotinamide mononucleotide adenyltransferase [Perilla frutescens var. frutescens]|nr:nicotinate/nicotinamide mononucleotide adenyltransferase [Perilla frutescens var. frutescens]
MDASNPELARDAVNSQGFCVIGGYMSPVNDSYKKKVKTICRDFGLVCIRRGGQDVENSIFKDDILNECKSNIIIVDEVVPNGISSTGLRDCISRGLSVKYLTADEVIDYIKHNRLYIKQNEDE